MTPLPKHAFRAEIDLITKSNNYSGPRLDVSALDRNTFGGAELLNLSLSGSIEAQLSGNSKNLFSYSVSPKAELYFPRFIVPFKLKQSGMYIPKTHLSLAFTFLKRLNYFDMRTLQFIYGFKWKEDIRKEHDFNPISVSYSSTANESPEFLALLEANPYLKKSYAAQFIAGASYIYTFNEQVLTGKKMQFFFQLTSELAGNAFSLAKIVTGNKISSDKPLKVAGSVYSQYARLSMDGRGYYNFRNKNKMIIRLFMGVAVPYGNALVLPYTKQFFSGGPNSIRAFQINSVGPGTFRQQANQSGFLQLGGDIKLEMNTEFRFTIYRFFKGALFTDAGNVWLLKSNPATTGTPFVFSGFAQEIAVGAGVGIRLDVSFFVLRFDLAAPLRKPWLEEKNNWVIDEISLGNAGWRRDNLILNVAIGYPF